MDKVQNIKVICQGGIVQNSDAITQGIKATGSAISLINYEPSTATGYQRILGYSKYSSSVVPGTGPVLGCKVAHTGIYVSRLNAGSTATQIFFGTGTSWGSPINATGLNTNTVKVRFTDFSISEELVCATNGLDYARVFDDSQTETVINGTGAPTTPAYAEMITGSLCLAPASAASSVAISAPNNPTDFDGLDGAVEINCGDTVTGLKRFRETLYVFCANSIWMLQGSSAADWTLVPVTRSIGCLAHDTIQELGGDLVFLAPDGFRSLAATQRIGDVELGLLSPQVQPLLLEEIAGLDVNKFSSCLIRSKGQYRIFFYVTGLVNDSDATGMIGRVTRQVNYYQGEEGESYQFSQLNGFNAYCADSLYQTSGSEIAIFGHPTNGYLYLMESGNSFDGGNISYVYKTPGFMFDDATIRKVFLKLTVYTQQTGSLNLTISPEIDFNNGNVLQPPSIVVTNSGSGATFGSAVFGVDKFAVPAFSIIKRNLVGSGYELAFSFTGSDTNPPHRIDALEIQYITKDDKEAV